MANYTLAPEPWQTFFYANGAPVAAGQLFTYLAGTTTPATTYSTSSGTTNTNPIILDAAGRCAIYLSPGSYRFDLFDSVAAGGALIRSQDNISSVPTGSSDTDIDGIAGTAITSGQVCYLSDGSGALTAGRWYPAKADNAYSSTTPEIAFAVNDIATGITGSFRLIGRITAGVSVTVGLRYYISSATAGAITSTAPTLSRFVGEADSGTSIVVSPNPPPVPLTGLTNHGVVLGQGTSTVIATTAGSTGQILAGVTGADPTFQTNSAVGASVVLLKANSGTDTSAGATTVDSIATGVLTAKDRIWVMVSVEEATAQVARIDLYSVTDATIISRLTAGGTMAAGVTLASVATINQGQTAATKYVSRVNGGTTGGDSSETANISLATAWTTGFTIGLRHGGVTATGTFAYAWAVYKIVGQ